MSKLKYIIDQMSPRISALDWVGRYGGLVQSATHGQTGSEETYPVACGVVSKNCNNQDPLHDLIPNDKVTSVVYWEEITPMSVKRTKSAYPNQHSIKAQGSARLVAWINLRMLGVEGCSTPLEIILGLEDALYAKGMISLTGTHLGKFSSSPTRDGSRDATQLFGKYSYPKSSRYYLTPYDFFSIEVKFEMEYDPRCAPRFVLQTPINC